MARNTDQKFVLKNSTIVAKGKDYYSEYYNQPWEKIVREVNNHLKIIDKLFTTHRFPPH